MNRNQLAAQAAKYLRDEADYNRSWVDGRRGDVRDQRYVERRTAVANEREAWADAIEQLVADATQHN